MNSPPTLDFSISQPAAAPDFAARFERK